MEKESSESTTLSKPLIMDESLEYIFSCMIGHGDITDALNFIRSIEIDFLPSTTVMRTIIFEILMKSGDVRSLALASDYLETILSAFPPVNDAYRQFYYDSIRESHGCYADMWYLFDYIVNSYFCQREIYVIEDGSLDPLNYPNCKFLLEFYVKLFSIDFEHRFSDSYTPCLVMKLLWPDNFITSKFVTVSLSSRTEKLFKWINDIYICGEKTKDMGDLLGSMHEMLTLMVKCIIQGKHNLSDQVAFSHPALADIVETTMNHCKDAFTNLPNVKLFLNSLSIKYLQAKVSEKIIRHIIRQSSKKPCVRTLKDIVDECLFPSKFNKSKNLKSNVNKEKNLRKRLGDKKANSEKKMTISKTTVFHDLCKENRFGDLLQALQSPSENVNTQDHTGSTPLHEACLAGHHKCVKILIDETGPTQPLDFAIANSEGLTPLHLAVMKDSIEIVKLLLCHGGSELLSIRNYKGQRPSDLSTSDTMNKVLQEYHQPPADESDSSAVDNRVREAPILKSFKEYSIYLHALNCLLCTYCDVFNLFDFIWQKNTNVHSHSDKICCHFNDNNVCSEDADLISEMPNMITTFIESVHKNVSKTELNVDIELIPLKVFAASLKCL